LEDLCISIIIVIFVTVKDKKYTLLFGCREKHGKEKGNAKFNKIALL
jgi:hypothetical protein